MTDADSKRLEEIDDEIKQAREHAQRDNLLPDPDDKGMYEGPDATEAPAPG